MSTMYKLRTWLRNPRSFIFLAGASAGIVAFAQSCPLLFPKQLYRPIMEAYKGGKHATPSDSQCLEYEEVCKALGVKTGRYHLFITSRWDPKVKGLPFLPGGVHVGIPFVFVDEPKLLESKFAGNLREKLNSEEGAQFTRSLNLSEKARKFALAKEVAYVNKWYPMYPVLLAPVTIICAFASTFAVQVTAGLLPFYATGIFVGSIYFILYRYCTGVLNETHDMKADEIVAGLGRSYVEGGLEYYEQMLTRNRALRLLLGSKGESLYSYYGNIAPGTFWSGGAPITSKRDNLQHLVQEMQQDKETES